MLRIVSVFLIFLQIVAIGMESVHAANQGVNPLVKFVVTAYYSPLPNQSFYLRGSYEADIALNGRGTHGASGKAVYPGMLAGPKTYAFGTKIYLEWLGVGSIDDRGGAIVSSGSRGYDADRIDVWVGYGEEGLKRALTWGKQTVTGRIVDDADVRTEDMIRLETFRIGKINKALYATRKSADIVSDDSGQSSAISESSVVDDGFSLAVTKGSAPESIKKVQTILRDLSYYTGASDGVFSSALESAIYDFQIENGLVRSKKDLGAGYYGVKTRAKLREVYARYRENEKKRQEEEARLALERKKQAELIALQKKEMDAFVASLGTPKEQEVWAHIRKLQLSLKALGYFSGKDTAIFGPATKQALVAYQTARSIVTDTDRSELWSLGSKTRVALVQDLLKIRKQQGKEVAYRD